MIIDNRYQVLKKLGIGGTGEVYRVYDRVKDREIVLKLLIYSKSEESLLLLKKEFLAITKLKHSYIIEVYDFVLPKEGTPYFTMEYIDGVDIIKATNNLRVKSRNSQIPITHNLLYTLIVQLCQALEFIHSHGLIHCDIKPGNILITRDKKHSADFKFYPKLLDFGLIESVDLSTTVGMRGTVEYMAPEMIKGYFVDRRTDLYSLGVVLYEAVTGKLPFEGDTPLSILKQHLGRNPISPNEYVKDIPDDLNRIILKLLSKYPGTRYQSGREIIHDISQIIGKEFELPSEKGWFLSSGFVGREKELSCLDNFLSEKRGKGVFITGEVGIGKSRLVEEFRIQAQLKGCSFWKGICYPGEREIYGPIVEILNELIPILKLRHPDLLEDYRESLIHFVPGLEEKGYTPQVFLSPQEEKVRLFDAIVQLLLNLSQREPYILFIDNIEWANEGTLEFINYFIRNIKNSNILLCLACEEKRDTGFISLIDEIESIRLDGLKLDEVNTLITSMLGEHRLSAYHIQQIYEEAHGNPLFIRELLKSMMGRVLLFQQGRWTIEEVSFEKLAISKTMKGVFEDQLKGLGEQAYEILRIGSIFGEKFQLSVIKQILNYSDEKLLTALRELLQRQLLTRHTNGYCFVSSQLREIVYNGIEEENRRSLHQTIGDILEEKFAHNIEPIIEELAYHFARGLNREKAFDFLIRAAKKSKSLYANKEAIRYFEQAVALIKPEEKRYSTLLKELGDTYRLVAEHDKAIDKYREVLSLSTPISSEKASLYCDIGISYRNKGEYDYALKSYNQGISIAQEDMDQRVRARLYQEMSWVYLAKADYDKALTIAFKGLRIVMKCKDLPGMEKIYHNLGTICLRKGKWDKAIQYFSKSLELKEKIDNLPGKAASYNNFGVVYSMRGNFAEALEYYKKGFEICKKIRDPIGIARGYKNLGIICYQQGNLTEAEDYYKKSLEIEERIGDNIGLSASYNNIGLIYIQQRRWEEAVNYFNHSLEIKEKLKDIGGIAGCYNNLGSVYKSKGDWDSAAQYYQKSFDLKEKIGDSVGIANSLINLGTIYINKGESEKALYSLEEAKKIGSKIGSKKIVSGAYQSLGLFYLNRKDIEEALKYNMDALKLVIELGNRLDEGIILRTLAKVYQLKKDNVTAEEHLLKSIEVLKETAIEVELAQSYMEIGELKRKTGNTKDSINYLGKAKEIFEELGMEEELEEVKSISKLYVSKDLIGIYQISSIINSILDYRELLNKVMDVAIETLEAERGVLIIKDKETDELKIEVICGVEKNNIRDATLISESIVKDVALKGNSLITTDAGTDSRFYNRKSIIDYHITSVLCVPLKIKEETIGAIYLDHHSVSNIFDQESLSFLTAFANLSAVAIENARLHEKLQQENVYLRQEAEEKYRFENIVGKSKEMKKMYRLLEKVIDTSTNVLLEGETGTGKEIVARTIHYSGPRREKKFIPVDCATIPHTLFEGELFGYIKGTFTGAINDKNGLFIEANEGTLFLDEITNISLELQAKLLRVLQEGEVRRLGEQKYRKVDVRIIAATNTDLKKEVDEGRFRADLYYRLNVIVIKLPPLRERREDIPLLAHHFLDKYAKKMDKKISGFSEGGMKLLFDYDWQGNVRELEHQIERAVTLATTDVITETLFSIDPKTTTLTYGERDKRLLGPEEGSAGTPDPAYEKLRAKTSLKEAVETLEREMILQALRKYKHKTEVAKALGLSRFGLQKKIERYGI